MRCRTQKKIEGFRWTGEEGLIETRMTRMEGKEIGRKKWATGAFTYRTKHE